MRVLLVSQMWPSPDAPDLGAFLVPLVRALEGLGHEVRVVGITRRPDDATARARGAAAVRADGTPATRTDTAARAARAASRHGGLLRRAVRAARAWPPDVVFGHMLFPAGAAALAAARAVRIPLVVMAHGQDVANLDRPPLRAVTTPVLRSAAEVIVNSAWLAGRLRAHFPEQRPHVIDLGVDLAALTPAAAAPPGSTAAAALPARDDALAAAEPRFLCVGSLIGRKNVIALADAFATLGRGTLTYVGDGPLREDLEGRPGVRLAGRVGHDTVPGWLAACDVLCQPSLQEPFGQAVLEALAMERSVVATREGGPAELVTPGTGVLVDPLDQDALVAALAAAAALPRPNPVARAVAAAHDVHVQAARMAAVLEAARGIAQRAMP